MAYAFLDVIDDIVAGLNDGADKAEQKLVEIDAHQKKLKADLAALKPRLLRAQELKSRGDLICAFCFIEHDIESPLRPIPSDDEVDRFRCGACDRKYELNA